MLIGLLGKPSSGKSTFFKASTLAEVEISSRPFTTLKSTEGVAYVKVDCIDKEFNTKCNPRYGFCINSKRFVPIKLMDVPGLIKEAHLGKGMGSQFLDDLNEADALIHIVDISGSTDAEGNQIEVGSYNPIDDIRFLETELDMWYLRILKKGWDKFIRNIHQDGLETKNKLAKQLSGLKVTEEMVDITLKKLNLGEISSWKEKDLKNLSSELRKLSKPIVIAANKIDLNNKFYEKIKNEFKDYKIIPCSADSELALREASRKELIDYIPGDKDFKIKKNLNENQKKALELIKTKVIDKYNATGVQDILNYAVFDLLGYVAIFPGGVNKLEDSEGRRLPDCFLLPGKSTALDFAYKIHKDLGDNFIRAIDVKTKKTIGKEYGLKNRDVIEIIAR